MGSGIFGEDWSVASVEGVDTIAEGARVGAGHGAFLLGPPALFQKTMLGAGVVALR